VLGFARRDREDSMPTATLPPIQPSESNADEIRVLGLITFVSLLVGAAIGVFDAELFLQVEDDVRTNAATYAMAAFTLQGMSFVLYKLLMQENLDHKASFAKMDRERSRRVQMMQQQMANKQMEFEMRNQEAQFARQLEMLESQQLLESGEAMSYIPLHGADNQSGIDLGGSQAVTEQIKKHAARDATGKFAKKGR